MSVRLALLDTASTMEPQEQPLCRLRRRPLLVSSVADDSAVPPGESPGRCCIVSGGHRVSGPDQ